MRKFQALVAVPAILLLAVTGMATFRMVNEGRTHAGILAVFGAYMLAGLCGLAAARTGASVGARRSGRAAVALPFAMSLLACAFGLAGSERDSGFALVGGGVLLVLCVLMLVGLAGLSRAARPAPAGEAADAEAVLARSGNDSGWMWHSLAVLCVVAGAGSVFLGVKRLGLGPATTLAANPNDSAPVISRPRRFEEHNFGFSVPGRPWVEMPKGQLNPLAELLMLRTAPEMGFMVIPERIEGMSGMSAELGAQMARAHLSSVSTAATPIGERAFTAGGVEGLRLSTDATVQGHNFRYVHWVGVSGSFVYQIIVWGEAKQAPAVEAAADKVFGWFSLLEAPAADRGRGAPETLTAPAYGLSLDLTGTRWTSWGTLVQELPDAAFGATGRGAAIAVVPVHLGGADPHPDALASALLSRLDFDYPGPDVQPAGSLDQGGVEGQEFTASRRANGQSFEYRIRVVRAENIAYLVAARQKAGTRAEPSLTEMLDRVKFEAPKVVPEGPAGMAPLERSRHGMVFNGLGLFAYQNGQYRQALEGFMKAAEWSPGDPVMLANALRALEHLEPDEETIAFLRPRIGTFPSNHDLRARWAALLSGADDAEGARAAYASLFSDGFRDQGSLADYVGLLIDAGNTDAAEKAVARYGGKNPSRTLRAQVLTARGDEDGAMDLLRAGLTSKPVDTDAAFLLLRLAIEAERHTEVIETCGALAAAGYASADLHAVRGDAEAALGRLAEAKASYEQAARVDPTNPKWRDGLRVLVAMLGEGDTSAVRTPIDPVLLPPGVLRSALDDNDETPTGAVYELAVTAIRFDPGEVHRRTEYMRARVVDRRGLDALGTLRFTFDPTHERLFVNRLEVRDEEGEVVATGDVSQYYVLDESGEAASQDRVLHIPVRSLAPGRTLELVVTREDLSTPREMPLLRHAFGNFSPERRSALVLIAEPEDVRFHAAPGVAVEPFEGGTVFSCDDQPAWGWEPRSVSPLSYLPSVTAFAASATWEDEARSYLSLISERLEVDQRVRDLAAKLARPGAPSAETVQAIAGHVQSEYAYRAIAFGPRAAVPSPAGRVIDERFGDCKDHALLAHLLLKAAGVPSHLALVSSGGWMDAEVPSRRQFDHMILYVPDGAGGGRFLDLTDKETDVRAPVPINLSGATALVLDAERPRLVGIPELPPGSANVDCRRVVRVEGTGLLVEETVTARGYAASFLRGLLRASGSDQAADAVRPLMSAAEPSVQVTSAQVRGMDDTSVPIVMEVKYRLPGRVRRLGSSQAVTPPCVWERVMFSADHAEGRRSPFRVAYPLRLRVETELQAGAGGPLPARLADRVEACAVFYSAGASEAGVKILTSLEQRPGTYAPGAYAEFAELVAEALAAAQSPIAIGDAGAQASGDDGE